MGERDLSTLNEDQRLAQAIANGEVSKEEVQRVWGLTEHLSAQTPFEVRKAVVALREMGEEVTPAEQFILSAVLDLRAALYRDESKFSHLVAGTETVVDSLRQVGPLAAIIRENNRAMQHMESVIEDLAAQLATRRRWNPIRWLVEWFWLRNEDPAQNAEAIPEEPYDRHIGSNWDSDNPRKK